MPRLRPQSVATGHALVFALASIASIACADVAHADERPRRIAGSHFTSAALRRVREAAGPSLGRLRRAAPGQRRVRGASGGRTYREQAWMLGGGATMDARIVAMTIAMAHPHPRDEVWYSRVTQLTTSDPVALAAAFGRPEGAPPAPEQQAVLAFAAVLAAALAAHPSLELFRVDCGWADIVGAAFRGVALLDRSTDELLWYHLDESWSDG